MRILKINNLPSIKKSPWCDRDYIMFYACFQIFEDCVEKEKLFDNWLNAPSVQVDLVNVYEWWKEVKENEDFDVSSNEAQEKLELLIKHRRYLWT